MVDFIQNPLIAFEELKKFLEEKFWFLQKQFSVEFEQIRNWFILNKPNELKEAELKLNELVMSDVYILFRQDKLTLLKYTNFNILLSEVRRLYHELTREYLMTNTKNKQEVFKCLQESNTN